MFSIHVEHTFAAAHAIVIAGTRETLHGHNWHVVVGVEGATLDSDGLLCDFHTIHETLVDICTPFHNRNLNDTPPFGDARDGTLNPTAELIARHIARELDQRLGAALAPLARISSVAVTEAPGCVATYRL